MRKFLVPVVVGFFTAATPSIADTAADFTGSDWADAISNIPCDHMTKNADGTWTVRGTVQIAEIVFVNPTLNDENSLLASQKCPSNPGG